MTTAQRQKAGVSKVKWWAAVGLGVGLLLAGPARAQEGPASGKGQSDEPDASRPPHDLARLEAEIGEVFGSLITVETVKPTVACGRARAAGRVSIGFGASTYLEQLHLRILSRGEPVPFGVRPDHVLAVGDELCVVVPDVLRQKFFAVAPEPLERLSGAAPPVDATWKEKDLELYGRSRFLIGPFDPPQRLNEGGVLLHARRPGEVCVLPGQCLRVVGADQPACLWIHPAGFVLPFRSVLRAGQSIVVDERVLFPVSGALEFL